MTPTGGMTPQNRTPVGSRTESLMGPGGRTGPAPRERGIRFRKTYKVRPLPVESRIYGAPIYVGYFQPVKPQFIQSANYGGL